MSALDRKLTLCAIVRDEEQLLPGCLESVRDAVDDLVVLDTGSRDRTPGLAREAGARVVHRAWDDDFAAARNAALAEVRTGWVLVLDADERLVAGSAAALRAAIAADGLDCGQLALHEADTLDASPAEVAEGRARCGEPVLAPRLLRRTNGLAYEGSVDEHLRRWLRGGRRVADVEASIVHYGSVPELPSSSDRARLRLRLLERRGEQEPADPGVRAALSRELLRSGDEARGREQADRAWRLTLSTPPEGRIEEDVVLAATLHSFQALARDDLDGAAEVLSTTVDWGVSHPNLDLLAGVLMESLALEETSLGEQAEALSAARAAFERCLARDGTLFTSRPLPGATSWTARTRLATIDLLCGRPDEALSGFEKALCTNPRLAEARLGRLEALLDLGMAGEALQGLEPWLPGGSPDAWTLAAAAAAALGSSDDASLFADRARDAVATRPWAGPHRRLRLDALAALAAA